LSKLTKEEIENCAIDEFGEEISFEVSFDSDNRKYIEFNVATEKDAEKLINMIPWQYHGCDTIVTYFDVDIDEFLSNPLE